MEANEKIRLFISSNFIIDDDDVLFSDDSNFFKLGFINSLFAMKLVNFIEKEFKIQICNNDLNIKNISTINNICTLIGKYKSTNACK